MTCSSHIFSRSGPFHINNIDWKNDHQRRSIAASLVNGVYVLECDRQASQYLAPPWWEFFHFKLTKPLVDNNYTIFGAIFEYHGKGSTNQSPRCVIAFRGTVFRTYSFAADIAKNKCIVQNSLHQTPSFVVAMKAVRDMVDRNGDSNVWLAEHSLGAAMAMLAGKTMAKEGSFLEAFLFNPPYLSSPIERIKSKEVKFVLHCGSNVLKAGLLPFATSDSKKGNGNGNGNEGNMFVAISGWIPCLFVNKTDPICSEYIGYFEHRKIMEEIGAKDIARFDSQHSLANLAMKVAGVKGVETADPLHLLPSANLTVNLNPSRNVFKAHELCQWWMPNLNLNCNV